jgi:hypothetical protein
MQVKCKGELLTWSSAAGETRMTVPEKAVFALKNHSFFHSLEPWKPSIPHWTKDT